MCSPTSPKNNREETRAKRQENAAKLIKAGLAAGVPITHVLRRRRLKQTTIDSYTLNAQAFLATARVSPTVPPPNLSQLLTVDLVNLVLGGAGQ